MPNLRKVVVGDEETGLMLVLKASSYQSLLEQEVKRTQDDDFDLIIIDSSDEDEKKKGSNSSLKDGMVQITNLEEKEAKGRRKGQIIDDDKKINAPRKKGKKLSKSN